MDVVAVALTDVHHIFSPLVQQLEHLVQGLQEGGAAGVQADLALDPVKERHPGVVLHPGDNLAQGGLGDVEHHRRVADVFHPGHCAKAVQLIEIHSSSFSAKIRSLRSRKGLARLKTVVFKARGQGI